MAEKVKYIFRASIHETEKDRFPDLKPLEVLAFDSWEASEIAAKKWGIRWSVVASYMQVKKVGKAKKRVCAKCGQAHYNKGDTLCLDCRREQQYIALEAGQFAASESYKRRYGD